VAADFVVRHAIANGFTVFSVTHIGDLVLATLTFDLLLRQSSQPLTVVTAPAPAPLLAADPRVRDVRLVRSSRALVWRAEVARELARARRAGQGIVNLEVYPPRWRFLRRLSRWGSFESRTIELTPLQADERNAVRKIPVVLPHRTSYYAAAVGLPAEDPPSPRITLPPAALARVSERLDALTAGGSRRFVVAHPGASSSARRAPLSLFAATLAGIAGEHAVEIVVVGNDDERGLAKTLVEALPPTVRAASWAGDLSLVETAALLARAALFLGNDSGPLKLAEAVGAPTLSFWGASAPSFAGPRGPLHRAVHFDDPPTSGALAALSLLDRRSSHSD
jgi:ADP-heptose:LPS heptosyltransferase